MRFPEGDGAGLWEPMGLLRGAYPEEGEEEMKLYRVTEVLSDYSDFSMVPQDVLDMASERGRAVHDWLAAYALGIFAPMPTDFEGYCLSGERWFNTMVKRVIFVEKRFTDSVYGVTGQPDLGAILFSDEGAVVDWKTPVTKYKTWMAQVAKYLDLSGKEHPEIKKGGALRLRQDGGTAIMSWLEDHLEERIALNAFHSKLNADRYFRS